MYKILLMSSFFLLNAAKTGEDEYVDMIPPGITASTLCNSTHSLCLIIISSVVTLNSDYFFSSINIPMQTKREIMNMLT